MRPLSRWAVSGIPFLYVLYLPVQSVFHADIFSRPNEILALCLYLLLSTVTLFYLNQIAMPTSLAFAVLGSAFLMPSLVVLQRAQSEDSNTGGWVVMGTAVLLTATAIRQQRLTALFGLLTLIFVIVSSYGLTAFFSAGLAGAIVFVLAGIGGSSGIKKANLEALNYRLKEQQSQSKIVALQAVNDERKIRMENLQEKAVPMLSKLANQKKPLTQELKQSVRQLELSLRDEIRGRGLVTPALRAEVLRLRNLGVEVAVLSEGGTDDISEEQLDDLIDKVVNALQSVSQGRVTIRSPMSEKFKITVLATLPGEAKPLLALRLS